MRVFCFLFIYFFTLQNNFAEETNGLNWDSKGNIVREEIILFPSGKKFISLKHEGGFETSIARYGSYFCSGNAFYNKNENLEEMNYACEFKDQKGEKFFAIGSRNKGSDADRSIGRMVIVEGEEFWKSYVGKICTYGLEYVDKTVFVKAKCN